MNRLSRYAICACVMLLATGAPGQGLPAPLAEKLPPETMLYAGWAGRSMAFDGSQFGQLVNEPQFAQICDALRTASMKDVQGQPQEQILRHVWAMAEILWQHPVAIGMTGFPSPTMPVPDGAIVADLGQDKDAFVRELNGLLETLGPDMIRIADRAVDAGSYRRITPPYDGAREEICIGFSGNVFFLTVNAQQAENLLGRSADRSLAAQKRFATAMRRVGGDNTQIAFFADVPKITQLATNLIGRDTPEAEHLLRVLEAGGLDAAQAIAMTVRIVDRGMLTHGMLLTPEPKKGLLALLDRPALTRAELADVPADAVMVSATKFSPAQALEAIPPIIKAAAPPDAPGDIDQIVEQGLANIKEELGIDVRQDVLAPLGDTWVITSAPSLGGLVTGSVLTVSLEDPDELAKLPEKLNPPLEQILPSLQIISYRAGRTPIHYLRTAEGGGGRVLGDWVRLPLAPAWAIDGKKLYVAGWPQVVASATGQGQFEALVDTERFAEFRKRVAGEPVRLHYADLSAVLEQIYGVGLLSWSTVASLASTEAGIDLQPHWLPSLASLKQYVWPSISTVSVEADGISWQSYGSLPTMGLESVVGGAAPLVVSVALPAISGARERAKEAVSASQLRGLALCVAIYNATHNRMPPSLAELVKDGHCGPEICRSPHAGLDPPRLREGQLVGQVDYRYVYYGNIPLSRIDDTHEALLLYEDPNLSPGDIPVAFVDGHVETVSRQRLRALLAEAKARKRSLNAHPCGPPRDAAYRPAMPRGAAPAFRAPRPDRRAAADRSASELTPPPPGVTMAGQGLRDGSLPTQRGRRGPARPAAARPPTDAPTAFAIPRGEATWHRFT